jgi:hypothetical protein
MRLNAMTARADNGENFGRKVRADVTEWSSPGFFALERRAQNDSKNGRGNLCVGNLRGVDGVLQGEVNYGTGTGFGQDGVAAVGRGG